MAALQDACGRLEMQLHRAVAARVHGELIGGSEGDILRLESDRYFEVEGVRAPDRYARVIAPL